MFRSLSLFSGCMGMDLGLEMAGIKTVVYVDRDPVCRETIRRHHPRAKIFDDVFSEEMRQFVQGQRIDVVVGGPPCQTFSTIGKRQFLNDERGKALLGFVEVVELVKPRFFILENVTGILSANDGKVVRQIRRRFVAAGYSITSAVLDAAAFGTPQYRKRLMIIGRRGRRGVDLPEGTSSRKTLRQAIGDLEDDPGECLTFPPSIAKVMPKIPAGGCWKSLKPKEQDRAMGKAIRSSGGMTAFYRRLSYDRPSPTLLTSPTQRATTLCHPVKDRPLSIAEYKRIQGFPDDWYVAGSVRDRYRQLGNALPVLLGKALGLAVRNSC